MLGASAKGVEIEACRRCQLLWFDRGEAPEPDARPPREHPKRVIPEWGMPDPDEIPSELWQIFYLRRGLPVEIDSPWFPNVPFATAALTLVVIVVGFLSVGRPGWVWHYGFLPQMPLRDAGITLFTYFFLHGGAWHLAGNAYFLVVFGDNVEEAAGRAGLLVLAFLGAAAGALFHAIFHALPLIGAGAGISALLAYYGLRFPRARIGWYWMNLPAWAFVVLWGAFQWLVASAQPEGLWHASGAALLGGAAVGVAFWALQRRMSPWTLPERPPS
jgi:membrane associated rhomboid family serine protease